MVGVRSTTKELSVKEEIVEADVLCVGGGIAGLMAAIRASELGTKVVIAEKANTLRSGAGATGNDHFMSYIPEVHGPDMKVVTDEYQRTRGGVRDAKYVQTWFEKSFDIIKLWDSWGIPMKYEGNYEFAGHGMPGYPLIQLKYAGQDQKKILTKQALERGAKIINRVMVFDLLGDGSVSGAIGISIMEDKIIKFLAKSVFLGTGQCMRLYPSLTPGWMFNLAYPPNNTGDGRAMAYRLGAELTGMEIPRRWVGPKYFARCGRATWVGVLRDPQEKAIGPFVTKPDKKYGDATAEVYTTMFEDYAKSGKGPVYMDCRGISDEDLEYMMHWLEHEGNTALINCLEEEGIDLRKNPVEFITYEILPTGGVNYNEKGETSVKGLYAAGDEIFGGISSAATFGWIAGENAAKYAKGVKTPKLEKVEAKIEEKKRLIDEIQSREVGANWKEVNVALQQIMNDHAGVVRSETMLKAGLSYLQRLKEKAYSTITTKNQHELIHCLEVFNLLDLAELIFITALERKETRRLHIRTDYPFTNPLLEKIIIVKKVDEKPVIEWRELGR